MKKYLVLIKHNIDFILFDLLALMAGYYLTIQIRYMLSIPVWHGELFQQFGVVVAGIYLVIAIITQSYRGIMRRSLFGEIKSVANQMIITWSVFTVILYMVKTAQEFSRSVYCSGAVLCSVMVLLERIIWKSFTRSGKRKKKQLLQMVIVCDSDKSLKVIDRLLPGVFFNEYQLAGVVINDTGDGEYTDYYPVVYGIENLEAFLDGKNIQEAYVEIENAEMEQVAIAKLLKLGVVVHRSLGDSKLNYQEQIVENINGNSVITVTTSEMSFSRRAELLGRRIWKRNGEIAEHDASDSNVEVKTVTERPLRIAMLGHKRIPSREGGVEIVVEELATRMVQAGHQVTAYNRKGHHVAGAEFDSTIKGEYKGVILKDVPTINKRGFAAMTSSVFASFAAAFGKYDVVHIHAEGPAFMCWLPKLCGKKVVVTIHGLDWARAKWGRFASWYINTGEKMAVRYADEIIVLSESVQKYFKDTYNRDTTYIPNGVTRPEIKEAEVITEKWGLTKDSYVLFLGRIVPEKGLLDLVTAWKNVQTDKKLVIAGSSSDTFGFLQQLKSSSGENVLFTGFVQGRILEELYSNAYIYVLPSHLEGMPLSLLEAMSYGNCCLTSDIPECKDVVGEYGITYSVNDINELTDKLQDLIDNIKKVEYYRKNVAQYICDSYSWEGACNDTLECFNHL